MPIITKNASELIDYLDFSDFENKTDYDSFINSGSKKDDFQLKCELAERAIIAQFTIIISDHDMINKEQLEQIVRHKIIIDEIEDDDEYDQYIDTNLNFLVNIHLT